MVRGKGNLGTPKLAGNFTFYGGGPAGKATYGVALFASSQMGTRRIALVKLRKLEADCDQPLTAPGGRLSHEAT